MLGGVMSGAMAAMVAALAATVDRTVRLHQPRSVRKQSTGTGAGFDRMQARLAAKRKANLKIPNKPIDTRQRIRGDDLVGFKEMQQYRRSIGKLPPL